MSEKSTAGRQADSGALKAWLIHSQTQKIPWLRQPATVVRLTVFTCSSRSELWVINTYIELQITEDQNK